MRHGKYPLLAAFLLPPLALYGYFVISPVRPGVPHRDDRLAGPVAATYEFVGLDNFKRLLQRRVHAGTRCCTTRCCSSCCRSSPSCSGCSSPSMLNVGGRAGAASPACAARALQGHLLRAAGAVGGDHRRALERDLQPAQRPAQRHAARARPGRAGQDLARRSRVAFWAVLAVMVWANVGFYVVLFGAAMQSIPRDIYEAAALDGASRWATLWRITRAAAVGHHPGRLGLPGDPGAGRLRPGADHDPGRARTSPPTWSACASTTWRSASTSSATRRRSAS